MSNYLRRYEITFPVTIEDLSENDRIAEHEGKQQVIAKVEVWSAGGITGALETFADKLKCDLDLGPDSG